MMAAEANKQSLLDYVDAFNRGDLDAPIQLFSPDTLVYGELGWGNFGKWDSQ